MTLTSPAVNYAEMEASVLRLWHEFLTFYFDGAAHVLGDTAAVVFPLVTLRFQQSEQPQPLDGVGITAIWTTPSTSRMDWELSDQTPRKRQEWLTARSLMIFQVRASGKMTDGSKPAALCRRTSDLLHALLLNGTETAGLTAKGIQRLRPRAPEPVKDTEAYALRMVACSFTLRCFVLSQTRTQP